MEDASQDDTLLRQAAQNDQTAINELLQKYRGRLKAMLRLRMNPQLRSRVDESDVLQEALLDAARKLPEYAAAPRAPFYLWLRNLAGLKLLEEHRHHLGRDMRDASRDVSIHGGLPEASSVMLVGHLLGGLTTPSQAAIRAETREMVQQGLEAMDALDREVLVLRHFEQLSTAETAQVLGISKSGAGNRYLRGLKRLAEILNHSPASPGGASDGSEAAK